MDDTPTLTLLLSDLWTIYHGCETKKLEAVGLDYLLANRQLIEFYLEQTYTKTDEAQRGELRRTIRNCTCRHSAMTGIPLPEGY